MAERIMAHLVAGYPDAESSLQAALGLAEGGACYLEVQFPFSDPTADGPLIQEACDAALRAGFRVADGFELVDRLRRAARAPVFIMSYANLVFARGVQAFLGEAKKAGAAGLIVPDLPVDHDEGLFERGRALGLEVVPVAAPNIRPRRLALLAACGSSYLYAALRRGITGQATELGEENLAFLRALSALGAKVLAGFGVRERAQVLALAPRVHAVVVGSAFVQAVRGAAAGGAQAVRRAAAEAAARLVGAGAAAGGGPDAWRRGPAKPP
jgi:tryptophan synthase alpha chain